MILLQPSRRSLEYLIRMRLVCTYTPPQSHSLNFKVIHTRFYRWGSNSFLPYSWLGLTQITSTYVFCRFHMLQITLKCLQHSTNVQTSCSTSKQLVCCLLSHPGFNLSVMLNFACFDVSESISVLLNNWVNDVYAKKMQPLHSVTLFLPTCMVKAQE